ncbi:uncharacterized protein ACMZJ9_005498 [Mantella aurantiaca]
MERVPYMRLGVPHVHHPQDKDEQQQKPLERGHFMPLGAPHIHHPQDKDQQLQKPMERGPFLQDVRHIQQPQDKDKTLQKPLERGSFMQPGAPHPQEKEPSQERDPHQDKGPEPQKEKGPQPPQAKEKGPPKEKGASSGPPTVKRPMNAFMVWSSEERKRVSAQYPKMHNSEISRRLGEVWRGLTEEDRRPYREEAKRLRLQHAQDHPGYKYTPRKKKKVEPAIKGPQIPQLSPLPPKQSLEGPHAQARALQEEEKAYQYNTYQDPYSYMPYPAPIRTEPFYPTVSDVSALYGLGLFDYGERRGIHPQVHYQTVDVESGGSLTSL